MEPVKAEAKTIPALKTSDTPTAKSVPAKVQEPMYTKAATPKMKVIIAQLISFEIFLLLSPFSQHMPGSMSYEK